MVGVYCFLPSDLPAKSGVRITDRPIMVSAVFYGYKAIDKTVTSIFHNIEFL